MGEMHVAPDAGHDAARTRIGIGRGDDDVAALLAREQHEVLLDNVAKQVERLASDTICRPIPRQCPAMMLTQIFVTSDSSSACAGRERSSVR